MTSAVDWLMSKFGTNFTRNSKFHIGMTILCQLRDCVTPALGHHYRQNIWCTVSHEIPLFFADLMPGQIFIFIKRHCTGGCVKEG